MRELFGHGGRALLLFLLLASVPARAADDRQARLESGEAIIETHDFPGSPIPEAVLTEVIDAPPERVWQVIDNCANYAKTMVRIKAAKELSREGGVVRCECIFQSPWPMSDLRSVTVAHHTAGPDRWVREWTFEAGDYKDNRGRWLITRWPKGRSLVEYRVHTEPRTGVPVSLLRLGVSLGLPALADKLRADVK